MRKYSLRFMTSLVTLPETYETIDTVAVTSATTIAESSVERDEKKAATPGPARLIRAATPHAIMNTAIAKTNRPFMIAHACMVIVGNGAGRDAVACGDVDRKRHRHGRIHRLEVNAYPRVVVGLQAHRAAEDPRRKDRETAVRQERRVRRDAPCKEVTTRD